MQKMRQIELEVVDFTTDKEGLVLVTISFLEKLGKMREIKREINLKIIRLGFYIK